MPMAVIIVRTVAGPEPGDVTGPDLALGCGACGD
jgi:hypothetical protein